VESYKGVNKLFISKALLSHVSDGDLHIKMDGVDYSTNLREIVTVEYMVEQYEKSTSCN
jgi:hypothetical protein